MSKPDKVKVWEWSTGKQAHFHNDFWWDRDDLVDAELVQGCRWLSDVLNGLLKQGLEPSLSTYKDAITVCLCVQTSDVRFSSRRVVTPECAGTTINGALLAACLKYMEAKHE